MIHFAHRRRLAYAAGSVAALAAGAALLVPDNTTLHTPGPLIEAHAKVSCESCHRSAPGTLRQQLSANARWLAGLRDAPAEIGAEPVDNSACRACHDRPDDRHPVFRFLEPRFASARATLQAHQCRGCHVEHSGKSVSTGAAFCGECHGGLEVKNDPLDVSHQELAAKDRFDTCLGCHDFHGNHRHEPPDRIDRALGHSALIRYFSGGPSPYTGPKLRVARDAIGN